MTTKISQKEYVKELFGKKKKSKHKNKDKSKDSSHKSRVKIIDDDIDVRTGLEDESDLLFTGEDAPQVVGIIDERPPELRTLEEFRKSGKWKSVSETSKEQKETAWKSAIKSEEKESLSSPKEDNKTSKSNDEDADLSPKRKRSNAKSVSAKESSKRTSDDDPGDLSPPRKGKPRSKRDTTPDLSPPRSNSGPSDLSPPRKRKSQSKRDDRGKTPDMSPPRSRKPTKRRESDGKDEKAHRKSSSERNRNDERKTGLYSAKYLKEESEKLRRREDEMLSKMSKEMSGQGAEINIRGEIKRKSRKEIEREAEKERHEKKKQEVYSRWGVGLKQLEDYKNKMSDEQHEMSKPLARYSNDADLEEMLKNQERAEDPMLKYIQKKRKTEASKTGLEKPVYTGPYPENRFNIRPGYRWDGVDRSNGYEKRWFEIQSQKKAVEEEAYRYSTEDM